jgi:hypothetical protein
MTILSLSQKLVRAAGWRRGRAIASMPALRELDVSYTPFGAGDAAALAESLMSCETLTKVVATSTTLGAVGAAAFSVALSRTSCTLAELNLDSTKLGSVGVAAIALALARNAILTRLSMQHNAAGVEGADALLAALQRNTTLRRALMKGNGLLVADVACCSAATGKRASW